MPIGVDTRFGYSNKPEQLRNLTATSVTAVIRQSFYAGTENPYFAVKSANDNRYRLRRPTGLAALCEDLEVEQASLFGHSEGGRVTATLAAESDVLHAPRLVVANAVGTGAVRHTLFGPLSNLVNNEAFAGEVDLPDAVVSAAGSTMYALTHARRWWRKRNVITDTNLWPLLDEATAKGTAVTVMHALGDMSIDYTSSAAEAAHHPNIAFIATEGSHSNVYTQGFRDIAVPLLAS